MDRIVDAIADRALHKLVLVQQPDNEYAVLRQAANRTAVPLMDHMTPAAAFTYWRKACTGMYYALSHNAAAARDMAERHIARLH